MSEFKQINDSCASGTSEVSEDPSDNFGEFLSDKSYLDQIPLTSFGQWSSNTHEEAQTKQLNRKIRCSKRLVGVNNSKLNGRSKFPYQMKRRSSRSLLTHTDSQVQIQNVEGLNYEKEHEKLELEEEQNKSGFSAYMGSQSQTSIFEKWTTNSPTDSGLGYTGSSPIAYGNLNSSSGFCSETDTSDIGTPTSGESYIPKSTTRKLRYFFQKNYMKIKDEIDPDELADILYSRDLMKKTDREKIGELTFRERKSDCLIKSLVLQSLKCKEECEDKFVYMVKESFQNAKYGYLMESFAEFTEPSLSEEIPINCDWKQKLQYFFSTKGNEIDIPEVIDKFLEDEVLTFEEHTSILDATSKNDKLKCLLESILNKTRRHFDIFCNLMKNECPNISKMLFDENVCEKMDITERSNSANLEIKVLKEFKCDDGETGIKLFLDGADGSDNELEEMIVDQHSPKPSESLVEMVTDDVHSSCKVSCSCIKLSLKNYSERALMILIEKCKTSPKFLERWVKELIDGDNMKKLRERNIKDIKFKIQAKWPDKVLRKQDIARNYGYLKDILEPKDYTSILEGDNEAQEVMEMIVSSESKEERAKKFLTYLVTSTNEKHLEMFSEQLKGTKLMSKMVKETRSEIIKRCTCKLTKNVIVNNFSFLEEKVEKIDEILDIFANCSHIGNIIKEEFQAIKLRGSSTSKVGILLKLILNMPDDGIQVCLFQDALIQTHQNNILQEVLGKVSKQKVPILINKDDISRNKSFLKQELEPMRFVTMLEEDPDLKKRILEVQSRRQRCEVFLDYLAKCSQRKLESFSSEIEKLKLSYIIDYLASSKLQGDAENKITKEDICNNMCFLDDKIDPLELRHLLSGNEKDKSRTALATVLSTRKRKRCKVFLEVMIDSEESIFNKFSSYLENEKPTAVRFLLNARETEESKIESNIESLLDTYTCIIAEVEPIRLREMFTEKQVICNDEFTCICSKKTRKGRAIALMEAVLNGPPSRAQCLIEALDSSGYKSLVNEINRNKEIFKPCQRLRRLDFGSQKCIVFEGIINLKFDDTVQGKTDSERLCPSPSGRIFVTNIDSPRADSGCEFSSVNTPGSGKASRYTPASSGYISESECETPGATSLGQTQISSDFNSSESKTTASPNLHGLRNFIEKNFVYLKEEIDPVELIDTLHNDTNVLAFSRVGEKLKYGKLRVEKCDSLFKSLSKYISKDDDQRALYKVIKAFEITGYGQAVKIENQTGKEISKYVSDANASKVEVIKQSIRHSSYLEDEIEPLIIIDELVSGSIITLEDHQEIKDTTIRKVRYQLLTDKILKKSEEDIVAFSSVIDVHYPLLAEQLKEETGTNIIGCKNIVLKGRLTEQEEETLKASSSSTNIVCSNEVDESTLVTVQFYSQGRLVQMLFKDINEHFEDKALENGFRIMPNRSSATHIYLDSLSCLSKICFLGKCKQSVAFIENWLPDIFTALQIKCLRDKQIDQMSIQIRLSMRDKEQVKCTCVLTKEAIVRHYTLLEKNLDLVDEIIDVFSKFNGFSDSVKRSFNSLSSINSPRTDVFLRKLLDLSNTRVHLCLLEKEMRRTNPHLLKIFTDEQFHTESRLTNSDIKRHMSFWSNELEPKHFIEMLRGIDESEHIIEKVMSNEPRRKRCRMLIDFITKKKICDKFTQELERRNKGHLVEFITAGRKSNELANIKFALVQNYRRIIDEMEPLLFKQLFIERSEISPKEYELIEKLPSRRQRAHALMRHILNKNERIGKSFLEALEITGYIHLIDALKEEMQSHKICPRLYQSLHGNHGEVVIKCKLKLDFLDASLSNNKETIAERSLTKRLSEETSSLQEAEIKRMRTHAWVLNHCERQDSKE